MGICQPLDRSSRRGSRRDNDIRLAINQLCRKVRESLFVSLRQATFNDHVAALDPAEFAQAPRKGGNPRPLRRDRSTA
jgi:hypothetical protein